MPGPKDNQSRYIQTDDRFYLYFWALEACPVEVGKRERKWRLHKDKPPTKILESAITSDYFPKAFFILSIKDVVMGLTSSPLILANCWSNPLCSRVR